MVREIAPSDKDAIMALALESWSDAPFHNETPDMARIEASTDWFLGATNAKGWLLCDGEIVRGVIGIICTTHMFTGKPLGIQWWLWVQPLARNGSGLKLIQKAEEWGKANGLAALQLLAPSPNFRSLCERLNYRPVEMMYQKDLA